jgi:hypothetical protein
MLILMTGAYIPMFTIQKLFLLFTQTQNMGADTVRLHSCTLLGMICLTVYQKYISHGYVMNIELKIQKIVIKDC